MQIQLQTAVRSVPFSLRWIEKTMRSRSTLRVLCQLFGGAHGLGFAPPATYPNSIGPTNIPLFCRVGASAKKCRPLRVFVCMLWKFALLRSLAYERMVWSARGWKPSASQRNPVSVDLAMAWCVAPRVHATHTYIHPADGGAKKWKTLHTRFIYFEPNRNKVGQHRKICLRIPLVPTEI